MPKTLAIATNSRIDTSEEDRLLETRLLERGIHTSFFHWKNVTRRGDIRNAYVGGHRFDVPLRDFDGVYLNSLGPIGGEYASRFTTFLETLFDYSGFTINDPRTMKDNLDKGYLLTLQDADVPVIPTRTIDSVTLEELEKLRKEDFGSEDLVLKPRHFGERMQGVVRMRDISDEGGLQRYLEKNPGELLVQPFLPEVLIGERSFVYVGDNFSHGVLRGRSSWNDNEEKHFRAVTPTEEEMEVCTAAMATLSYPFRVTRFDIIGETTKPRISEVERINPNLWLGRNIPEIDEAFINLFVPYIAERL